MTEPSNLTETNLKEIFVTWYLASKLFEHHFISLSQNNPFAESDFQIISALNNFNESLRRYLR